MTWLLLSIVNVANPENDPSKHPARSRLYPVGLHPKLLSPDIAQNTKYFYLILTAYILLPTITDAE